MCNKQQLTQLTSSERRLLIKAMKKAQKLKNQKGGATMYILANDAANRKRTIMVEYNPDTVTYAIIMRQIEEKLNRPLPDALLLYEGRRIAENTSTQEIARMASSGEIQFVETVGRRVRNVRSFRSVLDDITHQLQTISMLHAEEGMTREDLSAYVDELKNVVERL